MKLICATIGHIRDRMPGLFELGSEEELEGVGLEHIDLDDDPELAQDLEIKVVPSFFLVDAEENVLAACAGWLGVDHLATWLRYHRDAQTKSTVSYHGRA